MLHSFKYFFYTIRNNKKKNYSRGTPVFQWPIKIQELRGNTNPRGGAMGGQVQPRIRHRWRSTRGRMQTGVCHRGHKNRHWVRETATRGVKPAKGGQEQQRVGQNHTEKNN